METAGSSRSNRRKGRELALQALYQIEITGDTSADAVDLFLSHFEGNARAKDFARELVSGVVSQRVEVDRRIAQCTENWKLGRRFLKVDRVLARHARRIARATQIAEGFILDRRHVDGGEIARAQEPRELDGITPIRLDAVAGLLGDQRRRDDLTRQTLRGQIAVEAVPARARFIDERERPRLTLQASQQLIDVCLPCANGADKHGRLSAPAGGMRDRDGIFVDVKTDEQWSRLRHG